MGDDPLSSGAGGSSSAGMTLVECQDSIQKSFTNPTVKFLMENLEKSGCGIGSNFIKAENCEENAAGGFARGIGIVVCSNHLQFQDEVDQAVIHELIHTYDDCRAANLDWTNCAHQACSEIRANHLSGDCHFKQELLRGHLKMKGHEQECVKRRAMKSVTANPYCSEVAAKDAIKSVWRKEWKEKQIRHISNKVFDRVNNDDGSNLTFEELYIGVLLVFNDLNKRLPGRHFDPPTKEEVRKLMEECDMNLDGALDREEFVKFIRSITKDTFLTVSQGLIIALAVAPTLALLTKRSTENVPGVGKVVEKIPSSVYASLITLVVVAFQQGAERA